MDIGLYRMKYPVRKLIAGSLPACRNVHPNLITLGALPIALAAALACFLAPAHPALYLVVIGLGFSRMFVTTLDGLVAVTYGKSSRAGELLNRILPELGDLLWLPALLAGGHYELSLALGVMAMGWATTFLGLVGLAAGGPGQSVGPCGQTDRLAALMLFSLLQYLSGTRNWGVDFIRIFLYWLLIGGTITLVLRAKRSFVACRTT